MVSFEINTEIKTEIIYNRKVFRKDYYRINDIVWWVDDDKKYGRVCSIDENYCYIQDEYNNPYIKCHSDLFLDEANLIQQQMNCIYSLQKEIHNINYQLKHLNHIILGSVSRI
jgi:hypothetical protein